MSKEKQSKMLYAAMSDVDDKYVQEAMAYKAQRQKDFRELGVKAAAAFVGFVLFALLVGQNFRNRSYDGAPDGIEMADFSAYVQSVSTAEKAVSADRPVTYGQAAVYWSCDGGETVYAKAISNTEFSTYLSTLAESQNIPVEEAPMIWVSDAMGNVSSPYLKQNGGNVAFGHLFDYEPEVTPGGNCINYLIGLMT